MTTPDNDRQMTSFGKTWFVLSPFLIYFIVQDAAHLILYYLLDLSMKYWGEGYRSWMYEQASVVSYVITGLSLAIGFGSIFLIAKKEISKADMMGQAEEAGHERTDTTKLVTRYMFLGILAFTSAVGLNMLFSLIGFTAGSESYQEVAANQFGAPFLLGILLYGLIAPIVEETVFRGIIYNRMKQHFPVWVAMIVSSLLFGLYHENVVQGVYAALLGLMTVYWYRRYQSFVAPVLFHSVANISIYVGFHDASVVEMAVTPFNCVIFLAISVIVTVYMIKRNL